MFRREVQVFLFTGLLESGKTTFILDTLSQDYFATGERTLLIACEDGEVAYNSAEFRKNNLYVEYINQEADLTSDLFKKWDASHKPKRVIIEYNGMWNVDNILEDDYPNSWVLTQIISTVDYNTFSMYWTNMRSQLMNQLTYSDMIIFNRCNETTKRNDLRRNVKLFNKKAQIAYDWVDGFDGDSIEESLPFNVNANYITLEDDDYGIWYMDAMENPNKYEGKTINYNGIFFRPDKYPMNIFVPGRFAMTCCADDIAYLGFVCKSENDIDLEERQWINITAEIKVEYMKDYGDNGPVLYLKELKLGEKPEDDLIYF